MSPKFGNRPRLGHFSLDEAVGTGSVADPDSHPDPWDSFWVSRISIRIRCSQVRIRLRILQAKIVRKTLISIVLWLLYDFYLYRMNDVNLLAFQIQIRMFLGLPDPHPDPLVRGTDPRIRIRTKMYRIRNTALGLDSHFQCESGSLPRETNLNIWTTRYQEEWPTWSSWRRTGRVRTPPPWSSGSGGNQRNSASSS